DIVLGCGRPLLVVPYAGTFGAQGGGNGGGGHGALGRRVLVAWDGTREAARALHDALPLMAKAEAAIVMTVRAREAAFERDGPSLDRVVRHLQRHGIPAHAEET